VIDAWLAPKLASETAVNLAELHAWLWTEQGYDVAARTRAVRASRSGNPKVMALHPAMTSSSCQRSTSRADPSGSSRVDRVQNPLRSRSLGTRAAARSDRVIGGRERPNRVSSWSCSRPSFVEAQPRALPLGADDGSWRHVKIALRPNNRDFDPIDPIELTSDDEVQPATHSTWARVRYTTAPRRAPNAPMYCATWSR